MTSNVTCLGCGCLCDDLNVTTDDGRVVSIGVDCPLGLSWFGTEGVAADVPVATVDGLPADLNTAYDRAARLFESSHAPVIYGLTKTTTEAVREALALADVVGGRIWLDRSAADLGRVVSFASSGRVSATLGEVRNRADVVVFLGADPVTTHPRHAERYSVAPVGRFVPNGRAGRYVVVVDDVPTPSCALADLVFACPVEAEYEWLLGMRLALDNEHNPLAARLKSARYGALFYRCRQTTPTRAAACWDAAQALVRALNDRGTRFVLLGLGAAGNLAGAESALTWQGGFAENLDFRTGAPTPLDEFTRFGEIVERGETDLIVVVGDAPLPGVPRAIPVIAISPDATRHGGAAVAVATARAGVEAGGSVTRADGVVLPLRPPLTTDRPGEAACLAAIRGRVTKS